MIWNKEDIDKIDEKLKQLIVSAGVTEYHEKAPSYIFGKNWTDELRIKNGYAEVDGVWVQKESVEDYWKTKINDIHSILREKNRLSEELSLMRKRNREMEYGLRVAEKSLRNALAMTKEMLDE